MDRKLIHYLPPYMQEYKEIQAAQEAVEPEVENIWRLSKDMLREAFIASESEYGAARWEGILGLRPKDTDSLEVRNIRILAKINETLPYTMTKLIRFLDATIGPELYEIKLDAEDYRLELIVLLSQIRKIREVMGYMERVVPVNLILWYIGRQTDRYEVDIRYDSRFTARGDFYPRYNLEYLYLDNSWLLNDKYELSGYKSGSQLDFYPVSMGIGTEVKAEIQTETRLTVENDLWYLDDTRGLDGTKLLDADTFYYDL